MMESVQKFILSTAIVLSIITIGTYDTYTKTAENNTPSTFFYQQQETPFEKTIYFLHLNRMAVPQPMYPVRTSVFSSCKYLFCTSSDSNNLYNTPPKTHTGTDLLKTPFYAGIEYYIYTLRRISI